jgi:hypothetical protein
MIGHFNRIIMNLMLFLIFIRIIIQPLHVVHIIILIDFN